MSSEPDTTEKVKPDNGRTPAPLPNGKPGGVSDLALPLDQIICGDNCDVLGTFPRDCIDLVVTSPPYDDLRTYGGHDWDFYGVAWQLKRVLKPGGVIVWVVTDQTKDGSETGSSADQAAHFRRLGLRQHDTMIFQKPGVGACGSNYAYYQEFEFMFVFAKGKPRVVNRLTRPAMKPGNPHTTGSKQEAVGSRLISGEKRTGDECIRGNVWRITTGKMAGDQTSHPAPFPEDLATDHIRSWSNEGDIVLDPFAGSGTTPKMAKHNGRRWIGIEINPEYCEIGRTRLRQGTLFGATEATQ